MENLKGNWIWTKDSLSVENTMACFCEEFEVTSLVERLELRLTADTRYIAYLNGVEVGRGPGKSLQSNWFYNVYDITSLVKCGINYLAIRVWSYGHSNYQAIAHQPGIIYDVQQNGCLIACSDEDTKSSLDLGIKRNTVKRNVNLGFMEYYDSNKFDNSWISNSDISKSWDHSVIVEDSWGLLETLATKQFDNQIVTPKKVVEISDTKLTCQQVSLNLREALFPNRVDADASDFTGYWGVVIDAPTNMSGNITFPNRAWNGIIGTFKIDEVLYDVTDDIRDIKVELKKGSQLFLMEMAESFDDLYCHIEFHFDEDLAFKSLEQGEDGTFFVIGPTHSLCVFVDGLNHGEQEEYRNSIKNCEMNKAVFACESAEDILKFKDDIKFVSDKYIFFNEYIYSLVKSQKIVQSYPVINTNQGILWNNMEKSIIEPPRDGEYKRIIVDMQDIYVGGIEFAVNASQGTVIDIYGFENMYGEEIDFTIGLNNAVRYICKDGYQVYKTATRIGARFYVLTFSNQTQSTEIIHFKQNHSTYATSGSGTFRCNDYELNKIWDCSKQTHTLCMEDTFTDCPTFEQAFWIGDAQISANVNAMLYGEYALMRHCLVLATKLKENTPLYNALGPTDWITSIPMWTMNWMVNIKQYVEYTDDKTILVELYDNVKEVLFYLATLITDEGTFLINAWNMIDWAAMDIARHGVVTAQQGILAYCYDYFKGVANDLGNEVDSKFYGDCSERLLDGIDKQLWDNDKKMFVDGWTPKNGFSKTVSIQTHSLLSLYNAITDERKQKYVEKYLDVPPESFLAVGSPFMLFYLYETWIDQQLYQNVINDIKKNWGMMLRYDSTTCWEVFPGFYEFGRTRSYCHSWSSSPVYFLSKYVLGIKMIENGYKKIEISIPEVDLMWCEGSIPTPFGDISIRWSKENNIKSCHITVPSNIVVSLPNDEWKIVVKVI